jgi:hypothetical protein
LDAVDVCEAAAHELADRHLLLGDGGTALAWPTPGRCRSAP